MTTAFHPLPQPLSARSTAGGRIALDIGPTVVKIARGGDDGSLQSEHFHPRDFDTGIALPMQGKIDRRALAMLRVERNAAL